MKNHSKALFALVLALVMALTLGMTTACSSKKKTEEESTYTYRTFTSVSPSNWNTLNQKDNNDRQVSNYLNSSFFEFDFKRDAEGKIIDGAFNVQYSAATKLEDVTETYAGQYGIPEGTTGNRAWKITLRNDLKWNDGTAIKASDFVYSMEQTLDPKFKNYLASNYYSGNTILHNARNYVYQGSSDWFAANGPYAEYSADLDEKLVFTLGSPTENKEKYNGAVCALRDECGFPETYTAENVVAYIIGNGLSGVTKEEVLALEGKKISEIKADDTLKATFEKIYAWWDEEDEAYLDLTVIYYTYPDMDMDKVGIFAPSDYEVVVIFDNVRNLLDENGNLTYEAAYYTQDLPLVKKDLYESCKQAPVEGATLWTSTYGSSLATTASWGAYMLTEFQAGTTYTLSKNANWYGYGMKEYEGQYQTDKIVCRTIPEWNTAWQAFQLGELDDISIDPTIAENYRNSQQAVFTPSSFIASIHLQTLRESLEARQSDGVNKTILMQKDFRKALSLAIDRADYAQATTTSSKAGLGFFNSMHYYDVANGGVYRDTEPAKRALLKAYGAEDLGGGKWKVGDTTYDNIDDAEEALTGYNLTLARQLVDKAYDAAKEAGDIKDTDKVVLEFGVATISTTTQRYYDYISKAWTELVKGTKLEGRLETKFSEKGDAWADDFHAGAYDVIPTSGWSGGEWDPYYFIATEVSTQYDSIRYNHGWDTTKENLTLTIKDNDGVAEEVTLTIDDWYDSLNGSGTRPEFYGYPTESRLEIVAALEQAALESYWDIPTINSYTAELHSYKTEYATYEYNTFMSYGGIRYMTYKYNDADWASYVASQTNKTLDYTK